MNLQLQQELLRRYPKLFRKPERRPGSEIPAPEQQETLDASTETRPLSTLGVDAPYPHLERPGWTVFDERGFECGDGWFDIVDRLARSFEQEIEAMAALGVPKSRWPRIRQCKEKVGGLRVYIAYPGDRPNSVMQRLLDAEEESRRICECCGKARTRDEAAPTVSMCARCLTEPRESDSKSNWNRYVQHNLKVREMLDKRPE